MVKSIHGHYGTVLEKEVERLQKYYKEHLSMDISWREATDIAGLRSGAVTFNFDELKALLRKVRGVE